MIPREMQAVLNRLCKCAELGNLALLECSFRETGDPVDVLVAIWRENSEGDKETSYRMEPFALIPRDIEIADLVIPPEVPDTDLDYAGLNN